MKTEKCPDSCTFGNSRGTCELGTLTAAKCQSPKHTKGEMVVHVNAATEQATLRIGDKDIAFVNFDYHRNKDNWKEMLEYAHKLALCWNSHTENQ